MSDSGNVKQVDKFCLFPDVQMYISHSKSLEPKIKSDPGGIRVAMSWDGSTFMGEDI